MLRMVEIPFSPTRIRTPPHQKPKIRTPVISKWEISSSLTSSSSSFSENFYQTFVGQGKGESLKKVMSKAKKRVFFLDVNPLCYAGSTPSLHSFGYWVNLLFTQVSLSDPVIAVLDGEKGSEHRRQLLPSYKAHRWKFLKKSSQGHVGRAHGVIADVLGKCNVPVLRFDGHEADDVVATLVEQALQKGHKAVVASPDKDFKQLLSEDVQIVMPLAELNRWSFYTLKHYEAQYNCDPRCDLSLRCILGDEADGVPGIQHVAPAFGRKTALKLLKKHGSLEDLLSAAAVRTVGKQYVQDALVEHADYLRRNYRVLALRRDANVQLQEEWLAERDGRNDSLILSNFLKMLEESKKFGHKNGHT